MPNHLDTYTVAAVFLLFGVIEWTAGWYLKGNRRRDDWLIDLVSLGQLAVVIKPLIILSAGFLMSSLFPARTGSLAELPLWAGFLVVMIPDEFSHYWYHRLAHENSPLWKMHRTHHTSPNFQVTLAFRENWMWFAFMPGLWWSASMVYFGLGDAYILSTLVIGVHNVLIHTNVQWDRPLFTVKWLRPAGWLIERIIQLPSTHKAHHGLGANSKPMGNYGQFIFFWDVLFGTAYFPQSREPERYGIGNDTRDSWYSQLWFPFVRAKDKSSDLG